VKRILLTVIALGLAAPAAQAVVVTRGPYLQTPTPASMIVRWRTDVATDSRVRYGAAPGSLGLTADDAAPTTEHIVPLGGLAADTQYYYAVGSAAGALVGDDADHVFRTAPTPGTVRPVRVWVTGDGGFANADGMAVRDAYAAYSAGTETHLWLLLGDNAYVLGTDANYQAALFDMHHDLLRRVPPWPTFGNHEAFSSNALTETGPYFDMFSLPRAGEAGGVPSGTEAYYSFDYANIHFIVLDSHFSNNAPGSPMMLWLEADLQATTANWVVAFWHHPPYSKGALHDSDVEGREINMRANVLPLLESYGVDLVLCGHSHDYERSYLLDGHYGLSGTFIPAMSLDSGDGSPVGDGPYRKATLGSAPHEGAVYVVAGSSSEVRPATLNHPAMRVGLLELGSLVLDVDGSVLTGTFLNSTGGTTDTFRIVKSPVCPPAPRPCTDNALGRNRLDIHRHADAPARDRLYWRRKGVFSPSFPGTPDAQTDLAICIYDQAGLLLGSALPHGADMPSGATWTDIGQGFRYLNPTSSIGGYRRVQLRYGNAVDVRGKGAALAVPTFPVTPPVVAQIVNLDNDHCEGSLFTSLDVNTAARVRAVIP
jgi:calcineurin-like phosphoesterase family protein/purple acid phosphatase-like protein